MTSPTAKHERRNVIKAKGRAKDRKNAARNYGTTAANLPLNQPNANEKAQAAAKSKRSSQA